MINPFGLSDWFVVVGYFVMIVVVGLALSRRRTRDARDYFLAGGTISPWLAAISVLATTQSAATFLGGPDYGYRGDFAYLGATLGALIAAFVVARVLMPKFYGQGVTTVYELLGQRFGANAMRAAGAMFVVGRILAGGARLYLGAIAVSMIIFNDVSATGILTAAAALILASFLFTFHGGLRSIVWIDLIQFATYASAALAILCFLLIRVHVPLQTLVNGLRFAPNGVDKLRLFDFSFVTTRPFTLPAVVTGVTLLYIGNFGLDQDTTQRLLACKDASAGSRGLYLSVWVTVPVVAVFIAIGSLLYVLYNRPDLVGSAHALSATHSFKGADITIFMHFILTQTPPGLRGLATVGVLATAIGTTMSALNAMSSVLIQDFYRPWRSGRGTPSEAHFVAAGRVGMAVTGLATLGVAALSYYWQHYTNTPLLEFVLSVMNFAYAGLLGVYFVAVFTSRGSAVSVIAALIAGFLVILSLQPYVADVLGLPGPFRRLAFPWQLCLGTAVSFLVCLIGQNGSRRGPAARSFSGV